MADIETEEGMDWQELEKRIGKGVAGTKDGLI